MEFIISHAEVAIAFVEEKKIPEVSSVLHLSHVFISVFSEKESQSSCNFFYNYSVKLISFFFYCQLFKTCPNSTKYMKSESH